MCIWTTDLLNEQLLSTKPVFSLECVEIFCLLKILATDIFAIFELSTYPCAVASEVHRPCLSIAILSAPASAAILAEDRRKQWPVKFPVNSSLSATFLAYTQIILTPIGRLAALPILLNFQKKIVQFAVQLEKIECSV